MGFTVGIAALVTLSTLIPASLQMTSGCTDCHTYASCYNDTCVCNEGYTGDGMYCEDIDECDSDPCAEYASCYNNNGSFYCACNSGFTGDGITYCSDIPECSYYNPCDEYAYCDEIPGSYVCHCREGYTGNGTVCTSLCPEECGGNAFCTREYDDTYYTYTYKCQCSEGYAGDPTSYCEDIDECEEYCLEEYADCINTVGRYICNCPDGYFYSYILTECLEIDSDEPYRDPALVVEGCNEKRNAIYRSGLIQEVQEFIQEYLDAISQFSSGSGSGDRGSGSGDRGSGSGDRGSGFGGPPNGPTYGPPYGK